MNGLWQKSSQWLLNHPRVGWVMRACAVAALCYGFYYETRVGRHLRSNVELAADFSARSALGRSPAIDPRLKIIALDDPTADFLGVAELPHAEIAKILTALVERRPAAVLIPKMFTFGANNPTLSLKLEKIKGADSIIAAAGFVSSAPINTRAPLERSREEFDPAMYGLDVKEKAGILSERDGFIYGPHPSYWGAFDKIGHVGLIDGTYFEPFILLGERVFPHLSIFAARSVNMSRGNLEIGSSKASLNDGKMLVNFLDQDQIRKKTYSIKSVLKLIDSKRPLIGLNQDDVIVILPAETTGSIDYLDTPAGKTRSSAVFISQVSSMMSGRFISSPLNAAALTLIATVLGMLIGSIARLTRFASVLGLSVAGYCVAGILSFAYLGVDTHWLGFSLSVIVASFVSHSRIAAKSEMRTKVLRQALHRMISDDKIDQIAEHPEMMRLAPQEQNVTILFFDLVSFSLVSEGRSPKELFDELKIILNLICDCVYEHNGIVDKLLGDGALCLFGMSLSGVGSGNHADKAVECAVEIQKRMLNRNLSLPEGQLTFPVRIGIHTAPAFMGDLGNGEKIEFTVIGPGVNFARRLEEACESYRIMISATTLTALSLDRSKINANMIRRDIGIKHHDALFEAYEVNAFADRGRDLGEALKRYNFMLGKQRLDERFMFPVGRELRVKFPMGSGIINDFSATGVRIAVDFYVSSGVQTTMSFDCDDEDVRKSLQEHHLQQVHVMVRWGKPIADGTYSLGVQYVAMQTDVREILLSILRQYNEDLTHAQIRQIS